MTRYFLKIMLIMAGITGCVSQKQPANKYYVIEVQHSQPGQSQIKSPLIEANCEIAETEISPAFASRQIASRTDSHEITYYTYHQWAERPAQVFTRLIHDYISRQGIFVGVSVRFRQVASYSIESAVKQLEIVRYDDQFLAHLNFELYLVNNQTGEILLSHVADRNQSLKGKNINVFAEAIGQLIEEELKLFSGKMTEVAQKGKMK